MLKEMYKDLQRNKRNIIATLNQKLEVCRYHGDIEEEGWIINEIKSLDG